MLLYEKLLCLDLSLPVTAYDYHLLAIITTDYHCHYHFMTIEQTPVAVQETAVVRFVIY